MKRKSRLPRPALQLKIVLVFLSVALACVFLQYNLLSSAVWDLASRMPGTGVAVSYQFSELLERHLMLCLGALVPLSLVVGTLITFRLAGPVHRFEAYLRAVARDEETGPCRIRKGDELGELCEAINLAVAHLRERERAARIDTIGSEIRRPEQAPQIERRAAGQQQSASDELEMQS